MKESFDIDKILARWLVNDLTDEEKGQLQQWIKENPDQAHELYKLQSVWETASFLSTPAGQNFGDRWKRLSRRTITKVRPIIVFYRVAASLLFLAITAALIMVWLHSEEVVVKTRNAQIQKIELPDGSDVTLNSGSVIRYNSRLWILQRKVMLEGEGFFNVKSDDMSFVVNTGESAIKVLGTSFNVKNRKNITSVACLSGKVEVSLVDHEGRVILTKGMSGRTGNGGIETSVFDSHNISATAWLAGKLHFEQTPLAEVFDEIERYYDVDILYQGQTTDTFSGTFENIKPAEVLKIVCASAGLVYRENKPMVFIVE